MKEFSHCTEQEIIDFLNAENDCYERVKDQADAFKTLLFDIRDNVDSETREKIDDVLDKYGELDLSDIRYPFSGIAFGED